MLNSINTSQFRNILLEVAEKIQKNQDYLCKVDAAIGDGDHGISMAKGFKAVEENISERDFENIAELLNTVAFSLIDKIGGATGPLFATVFMAAGKVTNDKKDVNLELLHQMFKQAVADVCKRGGGKPGDKTMIDALQPAVEGLEEAFINNLSLEKALKIAYDKANDGVDETKKMKPRQGKSRYLGERAIGYQDAGATSISLIFEAMVDGIKKLS